MPDQDSNSDKSSQEGRGNSTANSSRRDFLKWVTIAGVAVAGAATVGGALYYKDVYLPSQSPRSVTVAYNTGPFATTIIPTTEQQNNIGQQNKLNINWQPFTSATAQMAALIKGDVDFYLGNFGAAATAAGAGDPVVCFLCWLQPTNTIVVKSSSSAQSLSDLKGQTIGVPVLPSASIIVGSAALQKQGIQFSPTDVKYVKAANGALVAELEKGSIDNAELFEPYVTEVLSTGNFRALAKAGDLWKQYSGGVPMLVDGLVTTQDFATKNPNEVKAMYKTFVETENYTVAHTDIIKNFFETQANLTNPTILNPLIPELSSYVTPPAWNASTMKSQQDLIDVYVKYGAVSGTVPSSFLTDNYDSS